MTTCYTNARVFTADMHTAACFVVDGDRFTFVGNKEDALRAYPDTEQIDLDGRFVCPGFNDSHMHLLNLGLMLTQAQLSPVTDSLCGVLD